MNNKKRYYKSRGGRNRNTSNQTPHLSINKVYDSNGPAGKVRGNAHTIYEKYQSLARDAQASGDRILAENHLQHAEHYLRIIHMIQEQMQTIYKDHPQSQSPNQNASQNSDQNSSNETLEDNVSDGRDNQNQTGSFQDSNGSNENTEKQEVNVPFLRRAPARRKPQRTLKTEIENSDITAEAAPDNGSSEAETGEEKPAIRRRRVVRRRPAASKEEETAPVEAPKEE